MIGQPFWKRVLTTGAVTTASTTATVSICGLLEEDEPAGPINAVSHIIWGDEAAGHDELSAKYSAVGFALNAAAVTSWSAIHEAICWKLPAKKIVPTTIAAAISVTGLAWLTDFHVVPGRFTPGFEKRLSTKSLLAVYASLALGLAAGHFIASQDQAVRRKRVV